MVMELRQLEYFVAVAETGSVTKAAQAIHLSQSALSTALVELERALEDLVDLEKQAAERGDLNRVAQLRRIADDYRAELQRRRGD